MSTGRGAVTVPRVTAVLAGGLLVVSALVVAFSAGEEPPVAPGSTSSGAPTADAPGDASAVAPAPAPYLEVPAGVDLTDQGASLSLGDSATVAWEPRRGLVGALEVTVRAVERAPISVFRGWRLTPDARASAAYFVRAQVENVGGTELSGREVPLYAVDPTNALIPPSGFRGRFEPCPSGTFPQDFGPGDRFEACLVYLVPDGGDLTAVSFRPRQDFDPITWTGEQQTYRPGRGRQEAGR